MDSLEKIIGPDDYEQFSMQIVPILETFVYPIILDVFNKYITFDPRYFLYENTFKIINHSIENWTWYEIGFHFNSFVNIYSDIQKMNELLKPFNLICKDCGSRLPSDNFYISLDKNSVRKMIGINEEKTASTKTSTRIDFSDN